MEAHLSRDIQWPRRRRKLERLGKERSRRAHTEEEQRGVPFVKEEERIGECP